MIKAIETRYKGYRFRSRLEARWAVFFDALGIKYKYEEYGFEKDGYRWLPDFYLPELATWVEVKGGKPSSSDAEKMGWLLDYDSPLPFFYESGDSYHILPRRMVEEYEQMGGTRQYGTCRGLLLLGDIPHVSHGVTVHSMIRHYEGLCRVSAVFNEAHKTLTALNNTETQLLRKITGEQISMDGEFIDGYGEGGSKLAIDFFTPDSVFYPTYLANIEVCKAYQKARSARFEHGETP